MRQVARQVLLDFYSRAIIDPNAKESDKKEAFTAIDKLQSITARDNYTTYAATFTNLVKVNGSYTDFTCSGDPSYYCYYNS